MLFYLQEKTEIDNTIILGFLTVTVLGSIGIFICIVIYFVLQCFRVSVRTSANFYRRSPLATSEHQNRMQRQPENSLGMIERPDSEVVSETTISRPSESNSL